MTTTQHPVPVEAPEYLAEAVSLSQNLITREMFNELSQTFKDLLAAQAYIPDFMVQAKREWEYRNGHLPQPQKNPRFIGSVQRALQLLAKEASK